MEQDFDTVDKIRYAYLFGEIAVSMGFITPEQLKAALAEQIDIDSYKRLRPQKLVGEILFENGWMTPKQIETVLEVIMKQ